VTKCVLAGWQYHGSMGPFYHGHATLCLLLAWNDSMFALFYEVFVFLMDLVMCDIVTREVKCEYSWISMGEKLHCTLGIVLQTKYYPQ